MAQNSLLKKTASHPLRYIELARPNPSNWLAADDSKPLEVAVAVQVANEQPDKALLCNVISSSCGLCRGSSGL